MAPLFVVLPYLYDFDKKVGCSRPSDGRAIPVDSDNCKHRRAPIRQGWSQRFILYERAFGGTHSLYLRGDPPWHRRGGRCWDESRQRHRPLRLPGPSGMAEQDGGPASRPQALQHLFPCWGGTQGLIPGISPRGGALDLLLSCGAARFYLRLRPAAAGVNEGPPRAYRSDEANLLPLPAQQTGGFFSKTLRGSPSGRLHLTNIMRFAELCEGFPATIPVSLTGAWFFLTSSAPRR